MTAFDVLLGSERVMWRLRHRALDLALLIALVFGAFILVAVLLRSSAPVVTLVNLDRGSIGRQIAQVLVLSSSLHIREQDRPTADAALRSGASDASIVFPPDFSARALANRVLTPEIDLAGASEIRADALVQVFSQALLSSAGAGGLQVQPHITYGVADSFMSPVDYYMVGALAVAIYLFTLVLPALAVVDMTGKGIPGLIGAALGCTVVGLIVGLLLLMIYLGPLGLHNSGSVAFIVLIELLAAASAALTGVTLVAAHIDAGRTTWVLALVTVTQVLVCGAIFAVNREPEVLRSTSVVLPLSDAVDALRNVMLRRAGLDSAAVQRDLISLLGFSVLLAGAISFLVRPRAPRRLV